MNGTTGAAVMWVHDRVHEREATMWRRKVKHDVVHDVTNDVTSDDRGMQLILKCQQAR
jgi:hypothetical protein